MSSESRRSAWMIRDCKASCSMDWGPVLYMWPERLGALDSLEDGLLAEILCRLPLKAVHRIKCVCRRWSALISSTFFVSQFIQHSLSQHPLMPLALLPFTCAKFFKENFVWTDQSYASALGLSIEVFGPAGFSLSFLPEDAYVVCVSRDLLMCCSFQSRMGYIANPLTKNWVALPSLGFGRCSLSGLICDPDKDDECDSGNVILAPGYKYKVVRILEIHQDSLDFELQVFSSESQRWKSSIVSAGARWMLHESAPVVCNGNVHWLTREHSILTCDLSSKKMNNGDDHPPVAALRFMNRPTDGAQEFNVGSSIGVFRRRLRTCNVIDLYESPKFRVWELVDYDSGDWRLENEVFMNEMTPVPPEDRQVVNNNGCSNLQERLKRLRKDTLRRRTRTVFHPHLSNVVYLWVQSSLICCNLESKTYEEISCGGGIGVFPYILPRWPSSIPNPFPPPPLPVQRP